MFFHFSVLFFSIIFALGLEFFIWKKEFNWLALCVFLSIIFWGGKRIGKSWYLGSFPLVFAATALAFIYFIDIVSQKHFFVFLSSLLFYLSLLGIYRVRHYKKDQTARSMIAASNTSALFFFYTAFYGIYLNFNIPLWVLMIAFLMVTFIANYQYFSFITDNKRRNLIYCLVLGLAMSEIAWAVSFWPFGYLTTGVIVLMLYYIMWDLIQSYFLDILSKRRVIANLIFFFVLSGFVLASSRWFPAV